MGRAQIKKKSTFIDMTAMSDVTVLLLTFFMLTSTFVKKEPVQVNTPASVSEIKIPETNVLQILVDPDGKIFMSLDKQQDMQAVLESMGDEYGIKFTPEQEKRFVLSSTFGVPIRSMQKFLDLPEEQRDKILKNEGIPCDSVDNQFKSWVDFTPMVDMNMLLITFFMLCTTLSKPQTMEISMPSNDKNITEEQKSMVKASQAITLLLGPDNKLYYYEGEPNYKDYTSLKETTYGPDGLRSILLQKNATAVNKVRALKQQKLDLKISDEEYKKQVSEIKSGKDTPTVIIKATDDASYMNLIDALDEMQICNIGKYVITDIAEADRFLIKNFDSKGELSQNIADK